MLSLDIKLRKQGKWSDILVQMIPASDAMLLWDKLQNMLSISEQLFSPSLVGKVILGNRLWPNNMSRNLPKWSLLQVFF